MNWLRPAGSVIRVVLGVGLAVGLFVAHIHFRLALVIGESMQPGLQTGDLLVVDKRAYNTMEPRRADVVLARLGREFVVKRVVALPGEEVELRRGRIYINRQAAVERYPIRTGSLEVASGTLFRGKYALLGDNRNVGPLELVHAIVTQEQLVGKVIWSFKGARPLLSWLGL